MKLIDVYKKKNEKKVLFSDVVYFNIPAYVYIYGSKVKISN